MVVSTIASTRLEDVAETGVERWFQLYVFRDRELTGNLVKRAHVAGYGAIVLTVDTPQLGTRLRDERNRFHLPPDVGLANLIGAELPAEDERGRPGSGLSHFFAGEHDASLSWRDLPWVRSLSPLPLVLKGIVTAEDARLAVEAGVDAIIVSNHGGRQLDGAPASIDALPEVVEAVGGRAEVYLDGGVRRGTDVLTALALGARAVLVGRSILWGLAVDGEAGVRAVLEMLRDELRQAMQLAGTPSTAAIDRSLVAPAAGAD
jgi:isopentenyl diphosphate isomerase/L-lactate dehydrogenase-like FMN-dependent dehydrogenase